MKILPLALGLVPLAFAASSAQAATLDVSPLVNEAIADILVPVLAALVPTLGAILVLPLRHFLDQKAGDLLAGRVDDVLNRAIAFGAKQAEQWVGDQNFHANVDGWVASIAADYAVRHAPDLMRRAGALASTKAGDAAAKAAAALLSDKIAARVSSHPAVAAVKAAAAPVELHPVAAKAA